jgi:hypothetical protein
LQNDEKVHPEFAAYCDCHDAAAMTALAMLPDVGSRALHARTVGMVPGMEDSAVQSAMQAHSACFGAQSCIPYEGACSDIRVAVECHRGAAGAARDLRGARCGGGASAAADVPSGGARCGGGCEVPLHGDSSEKSQLPLHADNCAHDVSSSDGAADAVAHLRVAGNEGAGALGSDTQTMGGARNRKGLASKSKRVNTDELD